MHHQIQFRGDYQLDLQVKGKSRLERVRVAKGDTISAEVKPYVDEAEKGPVEMADLFLGDDGVIRGVRMGCFRFIEVEAAE